MKPRTFALALAAALGLFPAARLASAEPSDQPNFILINIDDLGYADIGPFGSDNPTPHLDRMAAEGRLLASHYAAPMCSPSRASLMSGCYSKRVLPINHVLFPAAQVGLHPDETTVADILSGAGYATACFGKWHLGDQPGLLPTDQGFDTFFGIPYSNDMGLASEGARSNRGEPLPSPEFVAERVAIGLEQSDESGIRGFAQPPLPLIEDDKVVGRVAVEEQGALTRLYTERAVAYIEANRDRPFFLYLPHSAVHFPLYPADSYLGSSPNGLIGDWAVEVDDSVGQVLDRIRELGLAERTFVLFTSDNGGSLRHGSNNGPLRGGKGTTFEGGVRVCTIAWWPGRIPAGTRTDAITSMMDVLPTFARLAGAEIPGDRTIDGVDLWPILEGDPETPPRDTFHFFRGLALEAVRSGPWKLHLALADGPAAKNGKGSKGAKGSKGGPARPQLFHLDDDLGESIDLSARHPEVVERLQALVEEMDADLGISEIGPGCRSLGRVDDPRPFLDHEGRVRPDAVGPADRFP